VHGVGSAEITRLGAPDEVRGPGLECRLRTAAEGTPASLGTAVARLDTNRLPTEAIARYRIAGYAEVDPFDRARHAHHWFEKPLRPAVAPAGPVGLAGPGILGLPMALRLARIGFPLVVWNRHPKVTIDLHQLRHVLDAGQMSAPIFRVTTAWQVRAGTETST